MASLTTSIFVRFSTSSVPDGFDSTRYYQVYAIDVVDDEQTRFLLSDKHGRYQWVSSENVRRFNPRIRHNVVSPLGTKPQPPPQQEEQPG